MPLADHEKRELSAKLKHLHQTLGQQLDEIQKQFIGPVFPSVKKSRKRGGKKAWEVQGYLTPDEKAAGLRVEEDKDFVYLYYKGERVATWSSSEVSTKDIQKEIEKYL